MNNKEISVVINTYNAERHLERVLEAVKGFDEIVICDMESTDSTLAIARRYGCKIVTFIKGDCTVVEPARMFAIKAATKDWVLVIDADEIVTPELKDCLYKYIAAEGCAQGLLIPRKNHFMGKFMRNLYPDYQLRFFLRDKVDWPPYVHARPIIDGRTEKLPAGRMELAFIHLANETVSEKLIKADLYTENEIIKRKAKRYGTAALFHRPLVRMFKSYIIKGGFRMGVEGLIHAGLEGIYQFVIVAKMIEQRRRKEV